MNYATNCKFCKKPITIEIDDAYMELGDPLKILPLATCNRCADLRVLRRGLEKRVFLICNEYIFSSSKAKSASKEKTHTGLTHWTKEYAKMIAKWHNKDGMCWDEEIVNQMMEQPDKHIEFLARLWTMYRQWEKDQRGKA